MTKAMTFFVTVALCGAASAETLREATRDAMNLCVELGARSLEHCGTEMAGRSPEHSAARKSVIRMLNLRNAVVRTCQIADFGANCTYQADMQMMAGVSDALAGPVQYLQSAAPR